MYQSGWSGIIVNEGLCNFLSEPLTFFNNSCLQYIYVQAGSLENIQTLSITNMPNLEWFIVEDYAFYNTTSLTLSSI